MINNDKKSYYTVNKIWDKYFVYLKLFLQMKFKKINLYNYNYNYYYYLILQIINLNLQNKIKFYNLKSTTNVDWMN